MTSTATGRDEVDATVKQEQRNGMVRYDTFDGGGIGRHETEHVHAAVSFVPSPQGSGLRRALKL